MVIFISSSRFTLFFWWLFSCSHAYRERSICILRRTPSDKVIYPTVFNKPMRIGSTLSSFAGDKGSRVDTLGHQLSENYLCAANLSCEIDETRAKPSFMAYLRFPLPQIREETRFYSEHFVNDQYRTVIPCTTMRPTFSENSFQLNVGIRTTENESILD